MNAFEELDEHLRSFRSAPFLFVGSGLSRRYLGIDTWSDMLRRFATYTDRPYAYFVTSGGSNLPAVAAALADAFHEIWWTDERFEESRLLYGENLANKESPLKVEVARYAKKSVDNLPTNGLAGEELSLFKDAVVDGIITTNYDPLLEITFPEFQPFVGQDELLFADTQGVGEIYKIHGSCARPDSIVLTENDYARFKQRNPYLAAKLLAVFVEHPVLLLGYSLSDPNVIELLISVAKVLTNENLARLQDRLIFVTWEPDMAVETFTRTAISVEGFTIPVIDLKVRDFLGVFKVLANLHRKFPARLLRRLKEHVYELVLTNEPNGRLYVQDIDANTDTTSVDVVFGVGMERRISEYGYVGLSRHDLLLDVLAEHSSFNALRIVNEALPRILNNAGNVPIYRYLREAGLLNSDGHLKEGANIDSRISNRVKRQMQPFAVSHSEKARARRYLDACGGTLSGLLDGNHLIRALTSAPLIDRDRLDLNELRTFLVEHADAFHGPSLQPTLWAKLVCLYDYYAFGDTQEVDSRPQATPVRSKRRMD